MNVNIYLDKPRDHFTNLDEITGRVVLKTTNAQNVTNITVKLEGEARTRLISEGRPGEKPRPLLEVHKLLYKVQIVWPPHRLMDETWTERSYTIPPGIHEYPFKFKIPFNNQCYAAKSLSTNANFMGLSLEIAKMPTRHVKTALPPTLYFPGEAEIRYYCKVTVNRPQLLQQNPRAIAPFNFFPIEPPRPTSEGETYARRRQQFNTTDPTRRSTFPTLYKKSPTTMSMPDNAGDAPPEFSVEVRLPNPAIITCNEDLPLRILVKQLTARDWPVYLQSLQIELIGYTYVRAHEAERKESGSWVVVSTANMGIPIGSLTDAVGTETEINREYWFGRPLPNSVAPTFATCNLKRDYELEIRVGLGYGSEKGGQLIVLPLRLPVQVFSGIRPPSALLQAMGKPSSSKPPLQPQHQNSDPAPAYEPTPAGPGSSYLSNVNVQPQPSHPTPKPPRPAAGYEDAPPSYEDAIASDLPPIDGPRPNYEPPPAPLEGGIGTKDEKRLSFH